MATKYCLFSCRDPADEWGSDSDSDETDTPPAAAAAAATKKVQYYLSLLTMQTLYLPISHRPPRRPPKLTLISP